MSRADGLRKLLHTVGERIANIDPSPQARRWLRLAGYPVFALFVAVVTFASALPDERVKERLEVLLSKDPTNAQPMGLGMDVKAGELSVSLLRRGVVATNVVLRTRPMRPGEKPSRYVLDQVKIGVGVFGLVFQRPTYAFVVEAFLGVVEGAVRITAAANHYEIEGRDLSLGAVQGLQTALGPPLEGKLEGKLELDAPGRLLANANGSLELGIDNASFGDGKGKLVIPGDVFMAQGMTIPKVRLGKIVASINIEKGKARIDNFRAHSADGDVTIEGHIDLHDPLPSSQLHLFLRFKINEALLKKEPTLELLTGNLGAQGKRADGFIGVQITGSLAAPRLEPNKNPPQGVTTKADAAAPPSPAAPTPPAPIPPPGAPAPPTAPPPPASPDAAQAPPVDIPPPATPTVIKDGPIPPPPPLRGFGRDTVARPPEEGGTPPAPSEAPPPPKPAE